LFVLVVGAPPGGRGGPQHSYLSGLSSMSAPGKRGDENALVQMHTYPHQNNTEKNWHEGKKGALTSRRVARKKEKKKKKGKKRKKKSRISAQCRALVHILAPPRFLKFDFLFLKSILSSPVPSPSNPVPQGQRSASNSSSRVSMSTLASRPNCPGDCCCCCC
jgi:hypothetical protein